MNIYVIVLIILAAAFAVAGFLIVKGSIKIPGEKKDQYAKVSFGASLVLVAASILAYFFPAIREKLEERNKANVPNTRR